MVTQTPRPHTFVNARYGYGRNEIVILGQIRPIHLAILDTVCTISDPNLVQRLEMYNVNVTGGTHIFTDIVSKRSRDRYRARKHGWKFH